jgi:hypothetical protein
MNDDTNFAKVDSVILEQYKLLVNSYESAQQQRISLNNVFVFLYSAIITLYNFLTSNATYLSPRHVSFSVFMIGIITGIFWMNIIRQGIISSENKSKIIREIEGKLPMRVFSVPEKEDHILQKTKLFQPGYLEYALPFFMIAVLSVNFILFLFD